MRVRAGGAAAVAAMPLGVATDPAARGRGIFSALELANEDAAAATAPLGVTFPNAASKRVFLSSLGWRVLARRRVWAAPPLLRLRPTPPDVVVLDEVPPEADELAPRDDGPLVDARYLTWRYVDSPRQYRLLGALRGGRLAALVAVRPARGRVATVCHALGETRALARLLRALGGPRPRVALVPAGRRRAFLAAGFVPTPRTLVVLGKELRGDARFEAPWRFELGDFDVF